MGRLASDIGGTFTDLVYFDDAEGSLHTAKSLTTPGDLTQGVIDTIELSGLVPGEVDFFVHGGTTVINAITERKGARTALVTTAGFRDVLEIQRGNRPDLYNLRFEKERPFVPRLLRFEVRERVDASGAVLRPLEKPDLDLVVARCREEGVEAIAIQFLHSYVAPRHEAETAAYLRERLDGVSVTASHEITREWREYERANTAVLNAYVQPIVQSYFGRLGGGAERRRHPLRLRRHAVQRRHDELLLGQGAPHHAHGIGAGGGLQRRRHRRRTLRRAQGDLPRHRRHHREVHHHRGRRTQGDDRVPAGVQPHPIRLSAARAGGGHRGDLGPAAARSPGSTRRGCSKWGRSPPGPIRGPHATAGAAPSRP